jgi:hypothetical protein
MVLSLVCAPCGLVGFKLLEKTSDANPPRMLPHVAAHDWQLDIGRGAVCLLRHQANDVHFGVTPMAVSGWALIKDDPRLDSRHY